MTATSTSIREIAKMGAMTYLHHYMQTMTSEETVEHTLGRPKLVDTLASRYPNCDFVAFDDNTFGIFINRKIWAYSEPGWMVIDGQMTSPITPGITDAIKRKYANTVIKTLPLDFWRYCNMAIGNSGDTYR